VQRSRTAAQPHGYKEASPNPALFIDTVPAPYHAAHVKIGEWDNLGRVRGLLQRQLGEMNAAEDAAHVTLNPENGRLRILVATDLGLLEYTYAPAGTDPEGPWMLRGQVHRWSSVRGLRLQTDAQLDEGTNELRSIWRLVADEPKLELAADSHADEERSPSAVLPFARACVRRVG
jgi:hypothetical protein